MNSPADLYPQILRALAGGASPAEIAERFAVRREWVETIAATDGARGFASKGLGNED